MCGDATVQVVRFRVKFRGLPTSTIVRFGSMRSVILRLFVLLQVDLLILIMLRFSLSLDKCSLTARRPCAASHAFARELHFKETDCLEILGVRACFDEDG